MMPETLHVAVVVGLAGGTTSSEWTSSWHS